MGVDTCAHTYKHYVVGCEFFTVLLIEVSVLWGCFTMQ